MIKITKSAFLIIVLGIITAGARADLILSPLQQTTLTGIGGSTQLLDVMGVLKDTDPAGTQPMDLTLSSIQITVNSSNGNFSASSVDESVWFPPAVSLMPGQSTVAFDMFTIDFSQATMPDVETWNFVVLGDYDDVPQQMLAGNTVLGSGSFIVQTEPVGTPEPGSMDLTGIALAIAAACRRRRLKTDRGEIYGGAGRDRRRAAG